MRERGFDISDVTKPTSRRGCSTVEGVINVFACTSCFAFPLQWDYFWCWIDRETTTEAEASSANDWFTISAFQIWRLKPPSTVPPKATAQLQPDRSVTHRGSTRRRIKFFFLFSSFKKGNGISQRMFMPLASRREKIYSTTGPPSSFFRVFFLSFLFFNTNFPSRLSGVFTSPLVEQWASGEPIWLLEERKGCAIQQLLSPRHRRVKCSHDNQDDIACAPHKDSDDDKNESEEYCWKYTRKGKGKPPPSCRLHDVRNQSSITFSFEHEKHALYKRWESQNERPIFRSPVAIISSKKGRSISKQLRSGSKSYCCCLIFNLVSVVVWKKNEGENLAAIQFKVL